MYYKKYWANLAENKGKTEEEWTRHYNTLTQVEMKVFGNAFVRQRLTDFLGLGWLLQEQGTYS